MPMVRIIHNEPQSKQSLEICVRTRGVKAPLAERRHTLRPGEHMHVNVRAHQDVIVGPASSNRV